MKFYKKVIAVILPLVLCVLCLYSVNAVNYTDLIKTILYEKADDSYVESDDNIISLMDYPTHIVVNRITYDEKEHVPGAVISITDSKGNEVYSFTTEGQPYELIGILSINETYTFTQKNILTGHTVSSDAALTVKDTSDTQSVTIQDKYEKWIPFNNDSKLDTCIKSGSQETVSGTYYFLDNGENDVQGIKDNAQIVLSGNSETLSKQTKVYVSEGTDSEENLYIDLTYTEIKADAVILSDNTVTISNSCFIPEYENTYYNVKLVDGEKELIIRMRLEVQAGDVVVYAFQMNTNTYEGSVSEFNPSYRVICRCSKILTKPEDTSENRKIYAAEKYGTIYTVQDNVTADDMIPDSGNAEIRHYECTEQGKLVNWTYAEDRESYYYALTFKSMTYFLNMLDMPYTVRAYAFTEDGDCILGTNVCCTSIYDIAKTLYEGGYMNTESFHDYLYEHVLNIVAMKNNYISIARSMIKSLNVNSTNTLEYNLINNMYKDMYYYVRLGGQYAYDRYWQRESFSPKTQTVFDGQVYNTEDTLLEKLNTASNGGYGTVAEWIYDMTESLGYEGFYRQVNFNYPNTIVPADFD